MSRRAFDMPIESVDGLLVARGEATNVASLVFGCLTVDGLSVLRSFDSGLFRWNETTRAIEAELIEAGFVADDRLTPWGRFVLEVGGAFVFAAGGAS